jgi:hypothetical protein
MAYDKTNDLFPIQNDVLTTLLTNNTKISKLNGLKTDSKSIVKAINELLGKLTTAIEQVTTATQQANEAKGSVAEVKTEVQTMVTEIATQKMTEVVSGGIQNDEFACEDNQTVFKLSKAPVDKDNILLYVNGVKYRKADYRYDESANTVEWVNTDIDENHPHPFYLKSTDAVSAVYMSK